MGTTTTPVTDTRHGTPDAEPTPWEDAPHFSTRAYGRRSRNLASHPRCVLTAGGDALREEGRLAVRDGGSAGSAGAPAPVFAEAPVCAFALAGGAVHSQTRHRFA